MRRKSKVRKHLRKRKNGGRSIVRAHYRKLKSLDKWMFSKEKREFIEWRKEFEKKKEEREKTLCQNAAIRGPGISVGQCWDNKVERKVIIDYGMIKDIITGEKDLEILYLCNECTQRLKKSIRTPYVKQFGYTIKTYPTSRAP